MTVSFHKVLLKAAVLFILANLAMAAVDPLPGLGGLSLYNSLFPGRSRLPFGETPDRAYNFSLYQLDAMFASHKIAAPKAADEHRVILIGDSATWGTLLKPEETLAGQVNALNLVVENRRLQVYNLGYPTMSLMKDLLMLNRALRYQPDLIVWLMTAESFPYDKQLLSPIVQNNPDPVRALIADYALSFDPYDSAFVQPSFWDRTLIGRRRALADVFRLQLYGVMWAATGIDQEYPEKYELRANDFVVDPSFHDLQPPHLTESDLAFEVLDAGVTMAGDVPILFVNEPMFIANGVNSDVRYNLFYPRWAYDDYRTLWNTHAEHNDWTHLDLWDLVPPGEFTNSAVHLSPAGVTTLASAVAAEIERITSRGQ